MKSFSLTLFTTLFYLAIVNVGSAQYFGFQHFTQSDGLPTNELYHVMQDHKGFLWVSTDYGVCRYNGQSFEVFTVKDGLPNNVVFESYEDSKGRIWFRTMSKQLVYFQNDSIKQLQFSPQIQKQIQQANFKYCNGISERNGKLKFSFGNMGVFEVPVSNLSTQKVGYTSKQVSSFKDASWEHLAESGLTFTINREANAFCASNKGGAMIKRRYYLANQQYASSGEAFGFIQLNNAYFAYAESNTCWVINQKSKHISRSFPSSILSLANLPGQLLAVNTKAGTYLVNAMDLSDAYPPIFLDKRISGAWLDHDDGLWLTTLNEGLIYIANLRLIHDNKPYTYPNGHQKHVRSMAVRKCPDSGKDELFVAYFDGRLNRFINGKQAQASKKIARDGHVQDIAFKQSDVLMVFGGGQIQQWDNTLHYSGNLLNEKVFNNIKQLEMHEDTLYFSASQGVFAYYNDTISLKRISIKNPTVLAATKNGLYVGAFGRLAVYRNGTFRQLIPGRISDEVTDVVPGPDSLVWVTTKGAGIYCLTTNDTLVHRIEMSNGLVSDFCTSISFDEDGNAWIGTNKGLQRIAPFDYQLSSSTYLLNADNGLISDQVNKLARSEGKLWIGTLNGLTVLDTRKLNPKAASVPTYLSSVTINDTMELNKQSIHHKLPHTSNTLSFQFTSLNFQHKKRTYRYRLLGQDTTWITSKTPEVRYANLAPGAYVFEILGQNHSGQWNKKPVAFSFTILPAYWQTTWFWLSVGLVCAVILWRIIKLRISQLREKSALNESLIKARQQALNAQMNPHFVFNALNAINCYILEKEAIKASYFLSKFSALVRSYLENSFNEFVYLSDELTQLKNYLALEKLRCEDRFDYQIVISDNLNPDEVSVPPLLFQPFLENSIWHGFAGINYQGKLELEFQRRNDQLYVQIIDNGIGRDAANAHNGHKSRISRGMQITNKRLELAQKRYEERFEITTTDLYDEHGKASGTKVEIWLSSYFD